MFPCHSGVTSTPTPQLYTRRVVRQLTFPPSRARAGTGTAARTPRRLRYGSWSSWLRPSRCALSLAPACPGLPICEPEEKQEGNRQDTEQKATKEEKGERKKETREQTKKQRRKQEQQQKERNRSARHQIQGAYENDFGPLCVVMCLCVRR